MSPHSCFDTVLDPEEQGPLAFIAPCPVVVVPVLRSIRITSMCTSDSNEKKQLEKPLESTALSQPQFLSLQRFGVVEAEDVKEAFSSSSLCSSTYYYWLLFQMSVHCTASLLLFLAPLRGSPSFPPDNQGGRFFVPQSELGPARFEAVPQSTLSRAHHHHHAQAPQTLKEIGNRPLYNILLRWGELGSTRSWVRQSDACSSEWSSLPVGIMNFPREKQQLAPKVWYVFWLFKWKQNQKVKRRVKTKLVYQSL